MKKTILSALVFFVSIVGVIAQTDGIVITLDGQSTDISGGSHQVTAPTNGNKVEVTFDVINNTGQTRQWRITRYKLNVPQGWADGLCWGHSTDPFGGSCYSSTQMNATTWTSPSTQTVLFDIDNGEYGKLKPDVNPDDLTTGQAHYRYYITDAGQGAAFLDSVDLIVDFTASIKPVKEDVSVTIVPNPASDYINITANGVENGTLKIVDILGNVVYKDFISNSKSIVTSNFKTGVYFVTIEAQGLKALSRKIIIRH